MIEIALSPILLDRPLHLNTNINFVQYVKSAKFFRIFDRRTFVQIYENENDTGKENIDHKVKGHAEAGRCTWKYIKRINCSHWIK